MFISCLGAWNPKPAALHKLFLCQTAIDWVSKHFSPLKAPKIVPVSRLEPNSVAPLAFFQAIIWCFKLFLAGPRLGPLKRSTSNLQSADLYFPSLIRRHLLRPPVPPGTRTTTYTSSLNSAVTSYQKESPSSTSIRCTVHSSSSAQLNSIFLSLLVLQLVLARRAYLVCIFALLNIFTIALETLSLS